MVNRMTIDLRRAGAREPDAAWMSLPGIPLRKMRSMRAQGVIAASSTSANSATGPFIVFDDTI